MKCSIYRLETFFIRPSICLLLQFHWLRENDGNTESDLCTDCPLVRITTTCFLQLKEGHVERSCYIKYIITIQGSIIEQVKDSDRVTIYTNLSKLKNTLFSLETRTK